MTGGQTFPRLALRHVALILVSIIFLLPLLWMVSSSLKSNASIFTFPPQLIPTHPHWSNYKNAVTYIPFFTYLRNTAIISVATVVGTLFSCTPAAYAFSVLRWRGRDALFYVVLATVMIPFQVIMIPLYIMFRDLGWLGTLLPLIVPPFFSVFISSWFSSGLAIFLLRQFFLTLPRDLFEAASIDGASRWTSFWRVALPLSRSGLITVGMFSFLSSWTMFVAPLIMLNKGSLLTLSVGLQQFQSQHFTAWNYLMAASFIFTIPVLILFLVAQRYFVQGIALSGLKG